MQRFLSGTRYLIALPIVGLVIASAFFFIFGGIGLLRLLVTLTGIGLGLSPGVELEQSLVIVDVVEYVHTFLVGTVLYITAVGFYQLFIQEIKFPAWLKIDSTEELETNLIGVTVVVLAVSFMSTVFLGGTDHLLEYGAGIALPIAALGLFLALRAYSTKLNKETAASGENSGPASSADSGSQAEKRIQAAHGHEDAS